MRFTTTSSTTSPPPPRVTDLDILLEGLLQRVVVLDIELDQDKRVFSLIRVIAPRLKENYNGVVSLVNSGRTRSSLQGEREGAGTGDGGQGETETPD